MGRHSQGQVDPSGGFCCCAAGSCGLCSNIHEPEQYKHFPPAQAAKGMNAEIHNILSFLLGLGANKRCTVHMGISPFALLCHMLRSKHHWGSLPALA